MTEPKPSPVAALIALLDLETIDNDIYRGRNDNSGWKRVFGGQVVGQALVAAIRTVAEPRSPHSLHAYFIRPGDPEVPIIYRVERDRDGSSFTTRRVVAIQHGRPIFNMAASFQIEEQGAEHQSPMPDVPGPEGLDDDRTIRLQIADQIPEPMRKFWLRETAIEIRPIAPRHLLRPEPTEPVSNIWFRVSEPIGDDYALHQCMLAYASDMTLLDTANRPHAHRWFDPKFQMASLDHALWFHDRFRADEWLLYSTDSPRAGGARGFTRGSIFTRDGRLVASAAQEGLIRQRP